MRGGRIKPSNPSTHPGKPSEAGSQPTKTKRHLLTPWNYGTKAPTKLGRLQKLTSETAASSSWNTPNRECSSKKSETSAAKKNNSWQGGQAELCSQQSEIDNELPRQPMPNAKISPTRRWNASISSFFLHTSSFPRPSFPQTPYLPDSEPRFNVPLKKQIPIRNIWLKG